MQEEQIELLGGTQCDRVYVDQVRSNHVVRNQEYHVEWVLRMCLLYW